MDGGSLMIGAGGALGATVAVIHGVLTQRHIVAPLVRPRRGAPVLTAQLARLVPLLLHFSTAMWLIGGLTLIWASIGLAGTARVVACLLVCASFLYGAVANLWATRARHPGGLLMSLAAALVGAGVLVG